MGHDHSFSDALSSEVSRLVNEQLADSDTVASIKHTLLNELVESIKGVSAHYLRISPNKFIIKPAKLSNNSCVVLLNIDVPNSSNTYKLVVTEPISGSYNLVVFRENPYRLNSSTFLELNEEQTEEVNRQLHVLNEMVDNFNRPAVFTLMLIDDEIKGYEYAVVTNEDSTDGNFFTKSRVPVITEDTEKRTPKGPTPVPM